MKVHPAPKKRNITLRYDIASTLSNASACKQKKLRRLPHIFAKVLELPFHSDADVLIEETGTNILDLSVDELELDLWRFRLPASTLPELATAVYNDGELVVTVPKDVNFVDSDDENSGNGNPEEVWGKGTEISEADVLFLCVSCHW
ncbi:hypothetical protein F0562_002531 [Nyssa sinensis]|uniref:SHSP domain-containing protein n=1 Tax=Nyssa sinensis TaxID=561372 RepID=A0A5J5C9T6_9ASTE|nr:hypothetical protein F0562_002531 [Nyssa sinensis]